jgi:hypothetical protein
MFSRSVVSIELGVCELIEFLNVYLDLLLGLHRTISFLFGIINCRSVPLSLLNLPLAARSRQSANMAYCSMKSIGIMLLTTFTAIISRASPAVLPRALQTRGGISSGGFDLGSLIATIIHYLKTANTYVSLATTQLTYTLLIVDIG